MTESGSAKKTDKVDGRKLRRGKRGGYRRKRVHGADLLECYVLIAMMEQLEIPVYRHSKSNHVYSYRVKIALLVLRKRLRLSYAQFMIDLPSYSNVQIARLHVHAPVLVRALEEHGAVGVLSSLCEV